MSSASGRMRLAARVGVDIPFHERMLKIPKGLKRAAALGLWTAATCYSRARELDGFCPADAVEHFVTAESVYQLVEVGLFTKETRDGISGFRVLKFDEFNETKAEIDERLQRDRLRKRGPRQPDIPPGIRTESKRNPLGGPGEDIGVGNGIGEEIREGAPAPSLGLTVGSMHADAQPSPKDAPEPILTQPPTIPEATAARPRNATADGAFGMAVSAWADGIAEVTGVKCSLPRNGSAELVKLLDAFAAHQTSGESVSWARETAAAFARAQAGTRLNAFAFADWLNSGRPVRGQPAKSAESTNDPSRRRLPPRHRPAPEEMA